MAELLSGAYSNLVGQLELAKYELRFTDSSELLSSNRQLVDACLDSTSPAVRLGLCRKDATVLPSTPEVTSITELKTQVEEMRLSVHQQLMTLDSTLEHIEN